MSEDQDYHDDIPPPPYQRNAPSTSRQGIGLPDPLSFTSTSNTLDSWASWSRTQKDKIDISLKLKLEDQDKSLNTLGDLQNGITPDVKEYAIDPNASGPVPPLNIVIFYLGDEFDLIPLLLISLELIRSHFHRVRISTQEIHRDIITRYKERLYGLKAIDGERLEDHLEFYDVLAGPKFSIKNWSDDPRQMETTLRSLYRSTYLPCSSTGTPFAADLIISHPDTLAHVHLAELYGIPLHIISDRPISPTISFPHHQTTLTQSNTPENLSNYLSYALSENLIWRELGKSINKNFRQVPLGLQSLDESTGPAVLDRLKVPVTYIWDGELRKNDWKGHIDVTGFVYEDDTVYRPSDDLLRFLERSESVIYVNLYLGTIDAALKESVVSSLAGGLKKMGYAAILTIRGMENTGQLPSDVFVLDDQGAASWLLSDNKVSAIIYDGSSYMATLAIKYSSPSIAITLSTGDMYWPERLSHLGASPRPITLSQVTVESLSVALDEALSPERKVTAKQLAESVKSSDRVKEAVKSIHRHLPLLNMRCDIAPQYNAIWYHPKYNVLLSSVVAGVLVEQGKLEFKELLLNRPKEYAVTQADSDPMIGGVQAFFLALSESIQNVKHLFGGDPPSRKVDISSQQIYSIYNESQTKPTTQTNYCPQPITDFKSGMKEARREMTEGVKDGVKGFVNGPLDPLKRGNLIGGVFGLVGGSIGLVTQPLSGAIRSVESTTRGISSEISNPKPKQLAPTAATSPADVLRKPRMEISKSHARFISIQSKRDILDRWKECKTFESVLERRKRREEILSGRGSGGGSGSGSGTALPRDGIVIEYTGDMSSGSGEQVGERKWWKGKGRA
ncbi:uncharacterized protein L199_004945 [Kwoniella botswanensis]|uniref:uncharacterized protein n=1 Tax=Kwoniella botswanensis TaxID=1268659 RepID=UPI00315CB110